jgi:ribosome-binding protein aMBF1 (putative translation factor)
MPGPLHDDEDCRAFADNLRKMRNKWGWSASELGARSSYSGSVIANIETYQRPPTQD